MAVVPVCSWSGATSTRSVPTIGPRYASPASNLPQTKPPWLGVPVPGAMDGVGIADVQDAHSVGGQAGHVILVVMGAAVTEGEEHGRLADRPRPEPPPGAPMAKGAPITATSATMASQSGW